MRECGDTRRGRTPTQGRCVLQQLIGVWQALDLRKRMIVIGATAAMFAAILAISSMASKPSMSLLYAGLEGVESGEVVSALDQSGVAYEVRGDAIFVPSTQRDSLRMTLAAQGLPAQGAAGYELLDSLSGFGTTSQMFDAAYWRAQEGELARTIASSPSIRSARVHIAHSTNQPFRKDLKPTASVTITATSGGIGAAQAKALRYLVASAISGMSPDDVSVIDSARGLIASGDDANVMTSANDRASALKKNVERLLAARVGAGNAVVELSVETVNEREAITEHHFDPEGRVAISTDSVETTKQSDASQPGEVTVASNLPQNAGGNNGQSKSQSTETRERTNYEVSETRRELLRTPGAVKRLSVAVLVDGVTTTNSDGTTSWQPRSEAELAALKQLVASAVGFVEARGDVITLQSMQFEALPELGTAATAGALGDISFDLTQIIQIAVLALVALILGLFVARPILMQKLQTSTAELPAPERSTTALTGEIAEDEMPDMNMQLVSDFDVGDLPMTMNSAFDMGDLDDMSQSSDPVERLKKMIEARQSESMEILRSWMEDTEEKA
ncbi:flagellar basal-body MS-ring/collar protein FliF [uncultured Thioclava sp.]|uniref:flagellar basal-body MS-ring/collar protein FliF n=1 Tax=uncultured Thioclava sp. TaxID=473858 RepID=UPI0025F0DF8B|nr:flagellar basal-body MS-ring/collar protein FliF [uncultured Thioclava sp.]